MKQLTERICQQESGLVGGLRKVCRQRFEVEASDVGRSKDDYGGFRYKTLKITQSDVGKTIEVMSDGSGWTCWGFVL